MSEQKLSRFGLAFPTDVVERLDRVKGPYYSRSKYILKILTEHLDENEKTKTVSQGSRIETPESQATKPGVSLPHEDWVSNG